jgi:hypothetical protein
MFEITFALEIITFTTGLIFYNKINPVVYRLFIILLFFTIINEGFSHYKIYASNNLNKLTFYNSFFLLQFIIISIIFAIASPPNKFMKWISIFFFICAVILLFKTGISVLSPDYITLICLGQIVLAFCYLFLLYNHGNISNLKVNSLLFFSIGLIVALFLLLLYINAKRIDSFKSDTNSLLIFKSFNTAGNIIYYLLILYSFICTSIFRQRVGI